MKVSVQMRRDGVRSKETYAAMVRGIAQLVFPAKMFKKLHVIARFCAPDTVGRTCVGEARVDGKRIVITVSKALDAREMMTTIAHELAHVKQFVTGALQYVPGGVLWRGRFFSNDEMPAWGDRPWEQEALRAERFGESYYRVCGGTLWLR